MNKPQIIINGVKAAEFVLVCKYKHHILNDLIAIHVDIDNRIEPRCRTAFKLPAIDFKYAIGDVEPENPPNKIIWRGYYVGFLFNYTKYHMYVDEKHHVEIIPI